MANGKKVEVISTTLSKQNTNIVSLIFKKEMKCIKYKTRPSIDHLSLM